MAESGEAMLLPVVSDSFASQWQMYSMRVRRSDIRTNLFHGHKDPEDERDLSLCRWAAGILIPFMDFLLSNTTGETFNAYEPEPAPMPLSTLVE